MTIESELLKKRMAKAQANKIKYARQEQAIAAKLAKKTRAEDTHRKILDGVVAAYGCAASEEYRRLHEHFRMLALTLPKDRAVFNLPTVTQTAPAPTAQPMPQKSVVAPEAGDLPDSAILGQLAQARGHAISAA